MAYSSKSKSWNSCNENQKRECKALAAFTKLKSMLSSKEVEAIMPITELSPVINRFKWSGGSGGKPHGKSEKDIGISDDVLNRLFAVSGGDSLLDSWFTSADKAWKRAIDPEIDKRKKELAKLKKKDPKNSKVRVLEAEIKKLEADWTL